MLDHLLLQVFWTAREDVKLCVVVLIDLKNGCHVLVPVAVVRRTPNSVHRAVEQDLITFHTQLMSSEYLLHVVDRQEPLDHIFSEQVPRPSGTDLETFDLGIGI